MNHHLEILSNSVLTCMEQAESLDSHCRSDSSPYIRTKLAFSVKSRKCEAIDSLRKLSEAACEEFLAKQSFDIGLNPWTLGATLGGAATLWYGVPALARRTAAAAAKGASEGVAEEGAKWKDKLIWAIPAVAATTGLAAKSGLLGENMKRRADSILSFGSEMKEKSSPKVPATTQVQPEPKKETPEEASKKVPDQKTKKEAQVILAMSRTYDKLVRACSSPYLDSVDREKVAEARIECGADFYDLLFR